MGIWQFRLILAPTAELKRRYGHVPNSIPSSDVQGDHWWLSHPRQAIEKAISSALVETKSWSAHIRIWGHEQGDNILIGYDDTNQAFQFVQVELDAQDPINTHLVDEIAALATTHELSLLTRSGHVLAPDRKTIIDALKASLAGRFAADPEGTLKSLPKP